MAWMTHMGRARFTADHGSAGGSAGPRVTRPLVPGIPSRVVDPSGVVKRQDKGAAAAAREPAAEDSVGTSEGQLVVGSGISFKGEIKSCDTLVVYGEVEASLPARAMRIAEEGDYRGTAEVDEAEVAGKFDGTLSVRGRLTIAATGRVSGTIRYAELEIAAGGQITGDIQILDTTGRDEPARSSAGAANTSTAASTSRKTAEPVRTGAREMADSKS